MLRSFIAWFTLRTTSADIVLAQYKDMQRQIPLLYALLSMNALAVAYTHYTVAPNWMTVVVPGVLVTTSLGRLVAWMRGRNAVITAVKARALLRRTVVLSGVLAVGYIYWSLSLNSYGGAYEHAHVAIFIAITVIGCIFCLMQLPQAALLVTVAVTVPYLIFYARLGHPVFIAIALNILLVTAVMIQVLLNGYRSFTQLITTRGETERLSRENLRLAHTDALTGLPNRRRFFIELDERLEDAHRDRRTLAVGLIDLDRFKPVNDTHGHLVGDRLLEEVGARLRAVAGRDVMTARLGGDEFGFLVTADEQEVREIAGAFCKALGDRFPIDGLALSIGGSCGVALYPNGGSTAHALFDHADYALYTSKNTCRGTATIYSADHETKIRSDRAIEAALRIADFDAEMDLHFQPIVEGPMRRVVAVEALARWTHSELGHVRPDLFIAMAERSGRMHDLTLSLLRKALEALALLPGDLRLSFNLSAHDVTSPPTVLAILALVRQSNIEASRLTLELTETAVMRNFDLAYSSIQLFRSLGMKVALDDFGTGYSSLGYLHRLPIDMIKVDRSFVRECDTPSGRSILTSVLALSQSMDLHCIVEGVETETQFATLQDLGCENFQGYFFARPMPIGDLLAFLPATALPQAPRAMLSRQPA